jgi:hypothetical protein
MDFVTRSSLEHALPQASATSGDGPSASCTLETAIPDTGASFVRFANDAEQADLPKDHLREAMAI